MSVFLIEGSNFLLTCLFVVPCFLFSLLACSLVDPSLLSWYVFLPACVQANSALPEPAPRVAPARPLW